MGQLSLALHILFFHQKGWELESFLFIEFYPRVQTPALWKLLPATPPPPPILGLCCSKSVHRKARGT